MLKKAGKSLLFWTEFSWIGSVVLFGYDRFCACVYDSYLSYICIYIYTDEYMYIIDSIFRRCSYNQPPPMWEWASSPTEVDGTEQYSSPRVDRPGVRWPAWKQMLPPNGQLFTRFSNYDMKSHKRMPLRKRVGVESWFEMRWKCRVVKYNLPKQDLTHGWWFTSLRLHQQPPIGLKGARWWPNNGGWGMIISW